MVKLILVILFYVWWVCRLSTLPPVDYCFKSPIAERQENSSIKKKKEVDIYIAEGTNPEVYTEEHEKLLGDCGTDWELNVDGYDEDGDRIIDPTKGEKCHQCRYYGFIFDCLIHFVLLSDWYMSSPLKGLLQVKKLHEFFTSLSKEWKRKAYYI